LASAADRVVGQQRKRIDFQQLRVFVHQRGVKTRDRRAQVRACGFRWIEEAHDFVEHERPQAEQRIDWPLQYPVRCDGFDFNAAFAAGEYHRHAEVAVDHRA